MVTPSAIALIARAIFLWQVLIKMRKYKLGIIIAKDDGDGYYAQCPDLENCEVSADSLEEAREKIEEAVREYIDASPENYRRVFIDRRIITEVLEISSQS